MKVTGIVRRFDDLGRIVIPRELRKQLFGTPEKSEGMPMEIFMDNDTIVLRKYEEYKGGWIPCSERLPDKNGMYLCTQNRYDLATNKNIIRVSTELVEFYNGEWRRAKNLVITHWKPLPEPFKERDYD